jgi:hypothetical protein
LRLLLGFVLMLGWFHRRSFYFEAFFFIFTVFIFDIISFALILITHVLWKPKWLLIVAVVSEDGNFTVALHYELSIILKLEEDVDCKLVSLSS